MMTETLTLQCIEVLIDRLTDNIAYTKEQFIKDSREILQEATSEVRMGFTTPLYEYLVCKGVKL